MERAVAAANAFQKALDDGAGMDEIEAAADIVNDSVVWRAFQKSFDPVRMCRAADYSDQWVPGFSAYYLCLGGAGVAGGKCGTVTASQHWDMFKPDPMATRRRWYCPVCNKKYTTTFGLIVEIIGLAGPANGHYAHAEFPPQALLDSRFMMIERQFEPYKTPEALLKALPIVKPLERTILQPTIFSHSWRIDMDVLDQLSTLRWFQLLNLHEVVK